MEWDFDIVHLAGVKHQAADYFSQPPTMGTDDSEINAENPVMVFATRARNKLNFVPENTSEETHVETKKPQLPTLVEFLSVKRTEANFDSKRRPWKYPGRTLISKMIDYSWDIRG